MFVICFKAVNAYTVCGSNLSSNVATKVKKKEYGSQANMDVYSVGLNISKPIWKCFIFLILFILTTMITLFSGPKILRINRSSDDNEYSQQFLTALWRVSVRWFWGKFLYYLFVVCPFSLRATYWFSDMSTSALHWTAVRCPFLIQLHICCWWAKQRHRTLPNFYSPQPKSALIKLPQGSKYGTKT